MAASERPHGEIRLTLANGQTMMPVLGAVDTAIIFDHFSRASTDRSLDQAKSLKSLALPREGREVNKIKRLQESLGRECLIAFQYVSTSTPKLLNRSHRAALMNGIGAWSCETPRCLPRSDIAKARPSRIADRAVGSSPEKMSQHPAAGSQLSATCRPEGTFRQMGRTKKMARASSCRSPRRTAANNQR